MTQTPHAKYPVSQDGLQDIAEIVARGYLRLLTGRVKEKHAEKARSLDSSGERSLNVPEVNEAENPHDGGTL